jgi:hypothetical protein
MSSSAQEAHTNHFLVDTVGTGANIDKVEHGGLLTRSRSETMHEIVDQACMFDDTRSYKRPAKLVDVGVNATHYAGFKRDVVGLTFDVVLYGSIKLKSSTATTFCSITNQVFQKLAQLALWDVRPRRYSQSSHCRRLVP